MSAHAIELTGIDGQPLPLSRYAGKAVLLVNTASACGFTPQYAGLQKLWRRYRERGLVVLGVPSNDFGAQEPGDESEIVAFCTMRYQVDFPMAAKQVVLGGDAHPLYRWIVEQAGEGAAPKWNFHKYLIDPQGELAGAWPSRVAPEAPELVAAIEAVLPAA